MCSSSIQSTAHFIVAYAASWTSSTLYARYRENGQEEGNSLETLTSSSHLNFKTTSTPVFTSPPVSRFVFILLPYKYVYDSHSVSTLPIPFDLILFNPIQSYHMLHITHHTSHTMHHTLQINLAYRYATFLRILAPSS
jgi:hypothetical protein